MAHAHSEAPDRPWLPTHNGLRPAVYCPACGAVRARGVLPSKAVGYYTNVLGLVRRQTAKRCLTVGQVRLIVRALEANDAFMDRFQTPGEVQVHIFLHTVQRFAPGAVAACEQAFPEPVQRLWRMVATT